MSVTITTKSSITLPPLPAIQQIPQAPPMKPSVQPPLPTNSIKQASPVKSAQLPIKISKVSMPFKPYAPINRGGGVRYDAVEAGKTRVLISGYDGLDKVTNLINDNLTYSSTIENTSESLQSLGFSSELVDFKTKSLNDREYGGRMTMMALWQQYVPNISGVILLIDASNQNILGHSAKNTIDANTYSRMRYDLKRQLSTLASANNNSPLLLFATNQDKSNSVDNDKIMEILGFKDNITIKRQIHIQSLNIVSGDGFIQGMQWLSKYLFLDNTSKTTSNSTDLPVISELNNNSKPSVEAVDNSIMKSLHVTYEKPPIKEINNKNSNTNTVKKSKHYAPEPSTKKTGIFKSFVNYVF